jgi:hypothetical protein
MSVFSVFDAGLFFGAPLSVSKTVVKLSRASKMYLNGFQATKSIDGNYVLMSCLRLLTADRLRSCYTAVL